MENKWTFCILCDDLYMKFEDNTEMNGDNETLSAWLSTDVRFHTSTLEAIDKVIDKELEEELLWGNGYKAYIGQEYTEIHFNFEEDDPRIKPCKLPTKLLREIVAVWLEEFEKYRNSKK